MSEEMFALICERDGGQLPPFGKDGTTKCPYCDTVYERKDEARLRKLHYLRNVRVFIAQRNWNYADRALDWLMFNFPADYEVQQVNREYHAAKQREKAEAQRTFERERKNVEIRSIRQEKEKLEDELGIWQKKYDSALQEENEIKMQAQIIAFVSLFLLVFNVVLIYLQSSKWVFGLIVPFLVGIMALSYTDKQPSGGSSESYEKRINELKREIASCEEQIKNHRFY